MTQELLIDHLGAQGDGVALLGGKRVYVPGTLPGERVEARIKGDRGHLQHVIDPSPERIDPACRHFGVCGGCALQHLRTDMYKSFKTAQVVRALGTRGFRDVEVRDLVETPPGTRRRARLTAINTSKGLILGFNQRASHQVFDLAECPVLEPALLKLIPGLRDVLGTLLKTGNRGQVHLTLSESGPDVVFDLPGALDLRAREVLAAFAEQADVARVCWGADPEVVLERRPPTLAMGSVPVRVPPAAFLQASGMAEAALVREVQVITGEAGRVADLFSGLGTFALPLAAGGAQVHAFDGDAGAIDALSRAAGGMADGIKVSATERDLFRRPLLATELAGYDAVVMDPPRAGARAQAEALAASSVAVIAMVSCNPATFARDARTLVEGGYALEWVRPVDQFLWSADVELVASLRRV